MSDNDQRRELPDGLPNYRVLTGPDDAAFCHRVSEALSLGYSLYGSPCATFNGQTVILGQALIWQPGGALGIPPVTEMP